MIEVTHIERCVGARGGEAWLLRLACGHFAVRPIPRIRQHRMLTARPRFAPKRVKCIVCNGALGQKEGV